MTGHEYIDLLESDRKSLQAQNAELREQLRISDAMRRDFQRTNALNYDLAQQSEELWHRIYRLVFPEEAPLNPVPLPGVGSCSPYQYDKLLKRIEQLRNAV